MTAQLADNVVEGLLDISTVLGGGFDELAAELARQRLALLGRNFPLSHAVAFVADQHDGHGGGRGGGDRRHGRAWVGGGRGGRFLDPLDLIVEARDAGEGRARRDAVDQDETLAVADPLVAQRRILFLPCRVEHLQHARLPVNDHLLAVGVFDGGIVLEKC